MDGDLLADSDFRRQARRRTLMRNRAPIFAVSRQRWESFAFAAPSYLFLVFPILGIANEPSGSRLAPSVLLAIFAITYAATWLSADVSPRRNTPSTAALIAVLFAVQIGLWWLLGGELIFMLCYHLAVIILLTERHLLAASSAILITIIALQAAHSWQDSPVAVVAACVVVCGNAAWMSVVRHSIDKDLRARIALSERYSAAAQRQRLTLAADLHDVLGQQLTAMSVKAELLSKLLPPNTPVTARQQADDLAALARQALTDVRAVVAGTRRPQLEAEISEAASLLQAAGIHLQVRWLDEAEELSGLIAEVGPYLVREGAANIVHHAAGATSAELTIAAHSITLVDNGCATAPPARSGAGLAGLRERIGELGALNATPHPAGGWQLELLEAGR